MNGKYAKYIPTSYGFITKLEIVGDMLYVYTKETTKGEPHKYPLSEITKFTERLENQYKLISEEENLQIVKKDLIEESLKRKKFTIGIPEVIVILASVFLGFSLSAVATILVGLGGTAILTAIHLITLNKIEKKFDEEMDMVKTYLSSRNDIEKMNTKDPNVTRNLKSTTIKRIEINNDLRKENMIPEIFDITLLDDLMNQAKTKKELKKLLTNYMICVALRQPQVFVDPSEENKNNYEQEELSENKTKGKYLKK